MIQSRWAVLKCRFSDDESDTPPDELYERLFTGAGSGSSNIVDYFRDMSHGQLDLSRSQCFGWFTLPLRKADYAGNVAVSELRPGQVARGGLFDACRTAAVNAGANLDGFVGIVAAMNRGGPWPGGGDGIDLWGAAGGQVFCDRYSVVASLLAHEMAHGYGLEHSRREGSAEDYLDPWDAMSTRASYMHPHAEYSLIGPGLSAANMRSRSWLDERRVWRGRGTSIDTRIRLRPLHRFDLPGALAAEVPSPDLHDRNWLVEFRNKQAWDGSVPEPAVLLHRLERGVSYLVPGPFPGRDYLRQGDVIERGIVDNPLSSYYRLVVEAIDPVGQTCDLRLIVRRVSDPLRPALTPDFDYIFGGVPYDGGGVIIRPGGVVPAPPWDPAANILNKVALFELLHHIEDTAAREAAQRSALRAIIEAAQLNLERLDRYKVPAPKGREIFPVEPPKPNG
jgi:hypothetical protein